MKRTNAVLWLTASVSAVVIGVACIVASIGHKTRDIVGTWQGVLAYPGFSAQVALRLSGEPDGVLTATLRLPDQRDDAIPADTLVLQGDHLHVAVAAARGFFDGRLSSDGSAIDGRWEQGRWSQALSLKKVPKITTPRRPQTPKAPYPYDEIDVVFANQEAPAELAGTLTLPRGKGPHAAVLLISGGGAQDRNGTILRHRPFLVIADHLTKRGIAVLRTDDRGMGASTRDRTQATSEDYAQDALAGVSYLKGHPEIAPERVGLVGHSEGGIVASLAAAQSEDVAFLVMLAAPGLPGTVYNYQFEASTGRALGLSEAEIAAKRGLQERVFAVMTQENDPAVAERKLRRILTETDPQLPEARIDVAVQRFLSPWLRFSIAHDPGATLRRVKCPAPALFGQKDVQVPSAGNMEAIKQAFQSGGNEDYEIDVLPALNHFFQTCDTGAPSEYAQIEETFAPGALERITDWILEHVD